MSNAVNGSSAGHGPFADSEWQPVTDSASGHTYWWNVSTGETRWDTPESGTHSEEPVPGTEGAEDARSTFPNGAVMLPNGTVALTYMGQALLNIHPYTSI